MTAIPESLRSDAEERMVRFGYYLGIVANLLTDEQVSALVAHGYADPRDVAREASEWCYGPGREAAQNGSDREARS